MTTATANKLTDEDYQLSEVNQLGTLLEVYRLKPGDIRFLRRIYLLRCILERCTESLSDKLLHI